MRFQIKFCNIAALLFLYLFFCSSVYSIENILLAIATPKGVFLKWQLEKIYNNAELLIYRKREDRDKHRLVTKKALRRAQTKKELFKIIEEDLKKIANKKNKIPKDKNVQEKEKKKDKPKGNAWDDLNVSQKRDRISEMFFGEDPTIEFAALFLPSLAKALAIQYVDTSAKIPQEYTYFLKAIQNGNEIELAQTTVQTNKFPEMPIPKNLAGKAYNKKAYFQWDPVPPKTGVLGYNVYRNLKETGDFAKLNDLPITFMPGKSEKKPYVNYSDFEVKNRQDYWYRVTSVHFAGVESAASKKIKIRPFDNKKPDPVTVIKTEAQKNGQIKIYWKKAKQKNVSYYDVYRSPKRQGKYAKINKIPIPRNMSHYIDRLKKIRGGYYYKIKCVNFKAIASDFSAAISYRVIRKSKPSKVKIQRTIPGVKYIDIEWKKPKEKHIEKYRIYRAAQKNAKPFPIAYAKKDSSKYRDKNVQDGVTYYYFVAVIDEYTNVGIKSDPVSGHTIDRRLAVPPVSLQAIVFENTVRLNWKIVFSYPLKGFLVYRRDNDKKEFKRINKAVIKKTIDEYVDILAPHIEKAEYKIRAVNILDLESKFSDSAFIERWKRNLPAVNNFVTLVTKKNNQKFVSLHWKKYNQSRLKGFNVYRKEVEDNEFQIVNAKMIKSSSTAFRDTTAKTSTKYTYYIVAVNLANREGLLSETRTIIIEE